MQKRISVIGPLILITIGVLFLLANVGMLPLSFFEIAARFWPLIFVLIGLEIIIGQRSAAGALLVIVLWIALIGGLLYWAAMSGGFPTLAGTTEEFAQPLGDLKSATIDLNAGVANIQVKALGVDSSNLASGTLRHNEGTRLAKSFNVAGTEGRLSLKEEGSIFFPSGQSFSQWSLGLNPAIPIALRFNGGVSSTSLDLSALNIPSLEIDGGVSSVDVITPKAGVTSMRVKGGLGSLTITIPEGVGARIRQDGGLGSINISQARFPKAGDVYQSANYATAESKIDIRIDGGLGSITVR